MRLTSTAIALALSIAAAARAGAEPSAAIRAEDAQLLDVIYTAQGNVWKGVITSQVPGQSYQIVLIGGSTVVVPAADVAKIEREPNPNARSAAPATAVAASAVGDVTRSVSIGGPRLSLATGFAHFPEAEGSDDGGTTSMVLTFRYAHEYLFDRVGLRPGLRIELIPVSGGDGYGEDAMLVHSGGELAATGRWGAIVPSAGVGFGVTSFAGGADGAIHMDVGADLLVGRYLGIGAGLSYQRTLGLVDYNKTPDLSFVSFEVGITAYL